MDRKSWTVDVDGTSHSVTLDWTYWAGQRLVSLDGKVVGNSTIPFRWRSEQPFVIDGHAAVVRTQPARLISPSFRIDLEVDGVTVEPDPGRKAYWEV